MTSNPTRRKKWKKLRRLAAGASPPLPGPVDCPVLPCDVRLTMHRPGRVVQIVHAEGSLPVTYAFNAKGYRSEDFDPDALFRVIVVGESLAHGTALAFEDTFAFRLKRHLATALGLAPVRVNVLNFAVSGASSDYCARTVLRQVPRVPADLVICHLPKEDRVEYIEDGMFSDYHITGVDPARLAEAPETYLGFCEYYNTDIGRINQLKNILIIQNTLQKHGIAGGIVLEELDEPGSPQEHLRPFREAIDWTRILTHSHFELCMDLAEDDSHAGPRTHAVFAIALLDFCGGLMADPSAGQALRRHAQQLMSTDPDWGCYSDFIADLMTGKAEPLTRRRRAQLRGRERLTAQPDEQGGGRGHRRMPKPGAAQEG
jgi:hypothetical protein